MFTHKRAIYTSGITWFAIGVFLLYKGLHLIMHSAAHSSGPILGFLQNFVGSFEQAALLLVCLGLFLGFVKRFVLAKSVKRVVRRIISFAEPIPVKKLYSKGYLLLIGSMMGLGVLLRILSLPFDIHGLIDVAIGSSLMNGGMLYFRAAQNYL